MRFRVPKDWSIRIIILPPINVFVTFNYEISHTYRGTEIIGDLRWCPFCTFSVCALSISGCITANGRMVGKVRQEAMCVILSNHLCRGTDKNDEYPFSNRCLRQKSKQGTFKIQIYSLPLRRPAGVPFILLHEKTVLNRLSTVSMSATESVA